MTRLSAPIFHMGNTGYLQTEDSYTRPDPADGELMLSGPSVEVEEGHLPVRGDLAHIKLAGRYFVPHYAVPMPHIIKAGGARLLVSGKPDADEVCGIEAGTTFNVLDMAGSWSWGQIGEEGWVGHVATVELEAPAA